jgi:predicted RNase H-like HicB family nuclease
MKKTFQAYVEYDLDYKGYVVDVPSLPGCMSQGKTKREAIHNIRDAIGANNFGIQ